MYHKLCLRVWIVQICIELVSQYQCVPVTIYQWDMLTRNGLEFKGSVFEVVCKM